MKTTTSPHSTTAACLLAIITILLSATLLIHSTSAQAKDTPTTQPTPPATQPTTAPSTQLPLTITGGYETDPQDHGRPVILIANALKVTPEVFRDAFSHVHPAAAGTEPDPDQVRKNKAALMSALGPLGVTNDRLDEVSNYYRYNKSKGEMWKTTPAAAYATLQNGLITSITITNPGAGYSSPPKISLPSQPNLHLTATLNFTTDFKTNGSISQIKQADESSQTQPAAPKPKTPVRPN